MHRALRVVELLVKRLVRVRVKVRVRVRVSVSVRVRVSVVELLVKGLQSRIELVLHLDRVVDLLARRVLYIVS